MTLADQIAVDISQRLGPISFSRYSWPEKQPRAWQTDVLRHISEHLRNPLTRFTPCQVAISSGHGIGKSALISMLIWWGLSTCEDARIVITANTESQLRTKTWPEVSKWVTQAINADWFELTATSLYSRESGHQRLWRADAITWSDKNTEAFAGLHNEGKRLIVIYDEASAISDKIWEVTEGALTDENTEIIWLAFGNPTQNTGRFRECFGKFKHRWKTFQIDSRTVEGTNKAQITKWEQDWGEDSDFFRVRVRGEFPRSGTGQFIASDAVANCRKFLAEGYESLAKIMSVDVARFGDDETVIGCRQGRRFRILDRGRGWDTVQTAEHTIAAIKAESPDATVIDGDGIGGGVVDHMKHRNYPVHEFHGGASAFDPNKYFNRRAEVWGAMRDWINVGAQVPDLPELDDDLAGPQYFFSNRGSIQLEKKDDMKARGMASPNIGDSLAMSFSVDVLPKQKDDEEEFAGAYAYGSGWMG